jgi:hypothetical protein
MLSMTNLGPNLIKKWAVAANAEKTLLLNVIKKALNGRLSVAFKA